MKTGTLLVATILVALLTGCGKNENAPFERVEFYSITDGQLVADAWVKSTGPKCALKGDAEQNVVYVEHPRGKWALPDSVETHGEAVKNTSGTGPEHVLAPERCPVAVYHLLDETGKVEIGYYKRRFARPLTPPM